jgi:protein-tyrosine-phosphatase
MAKVILEQILIKKGLQDKIFVDSAARYHPTAPTATVQARETIRQIYGSDLLAGHKSKSVKDIDLAQYDLILTMEAGHKVGLPPNKTYTLKEFAGLAGDIEDPYHKPLTEYLKCAKEITQCLELIVDGIVPK